ncbi:unnamed protein product [Cuscuta epithymum]|uniref:Uncharacterized protein n=1 Tax=Cuscuta epithymum TaxID=186058 RepID=A0AAV0GI43_9ASTE|nr:unnamed protein product [Cuscuta epithymum]
MPTYAMNVFLLPNDLCREIEVLMNGYWWKGKAGSGIRWKNWASLSTPKKVGGLGFRKLHEFNLAMLSKQAWRLFTNPDSLVGRVFKSRYFPRGTFLTATLGHTPSFVWRSLFETQNIIRDGFKWRVGDGRSINIWEDPWLPDPTNPKVITVSGEGLHEAVVRSLMDVDGKEWDIDILNDILEGRDVDLIRRIPLSLRPVSDVKQWRWEEDGRFSVKSCYRRIVGEINPVNWTGWTEMWNWKIPPKIKFFFDRFVAVVCLRKIC